MKGSIVIDKDAIARVAAIAAAECAGVVGMAARSMSDGLTRLLKRKSLSKGARVSYSKKRLAISLYVIVEYGTNITAIAETLKTNVKHIVEEQIGLNVDEVNVFVEDVRVSPQED